MSAYDQGWLSFDKGIFRTDNPFWSDEELHYRKEWYRGWDESRRWTEKQKERKINNG